MTSWVSTRISLLEFIPTLIFGEWESPPGHNTSKARVCLEKRNLQQTGTVIVACGFATAPQLFDHLDTEKTGSLDFQAPSLRTYEGNMTGYMGRVEGQAATAKCPECF